MSKTVETPLMRQYFDIKSKHPDAILLFRVGDFYEMYGEDAVVGAAILGIVQTRRNNGGVQQMEMAGFPYHALDSYLPKLVRAGKRVAICDQLEDPKATTKLVKRGITELVTPGVSINDNILNHRENNFLAAVHFGQDICGVAFLDISTGEFLTSEGPLAYIDKLLNNFAPKEVLIKRTLRNLFEETFGTRFLLFEMEDWTFHPETASQWLQKQFETVTLKGFGIQELRYGIIASGAVLVYLDLTQHTQTSHITSVSRIEEEQFMRLDKFTVRSLEVLHTMNEGGCALMDIIDKTTSPMGARLLRRWVVFPLKDMQAIRKRQDVAVYFFHHHTLREKLSNLIGNMGDIERIISKVVTGRVSPREIVQLKAALLAIGEIKSLCSESSEAELAAFGELLNPCEMIRIQMEKEIVEDPPAQANKGGVIARGVHRELDELRDIAYKGKDYLMQIQQRESEQTGISSLKVAYNSVFGYYIEVRNTHKDKVPSDWIRKQTLVNAERYITQELKVYEEKILGAEEKILELEMRLFNELVLAVAGYTQPIQQNAQVIAHLDCMLSFADTAIRNNYVKPLVDESDVIDIREGRHPVIEQQLPPDEPYVTNNVYLNRNKQQILIITGPNMAGKSALLRQTALITLMAQIGSFVPAKKARIGLVDKIFTRVGASDNISLGESTFMVEMTEAAEILNNITPRSLIVFDELGRGTSTYDGISIAWAIVEYIHEHPTAGARTLFATHYHELNEMERSFKRVKNFNISVKDTGNKVIFLRKLVPGISAHSFGIHVAKMAGMPKSIVKRADEILKLLEAGNNQSGVTSKPVKGLASSGEGYQLNFFQLDDPMLDQVRNEIKNLEINNLTPLEALNKLNDIKRIING
ncbi:MAG: DNA mismatch repair protein MutS [Tannerella sp.]|nr:DNA mismatch repair protein MutS [Tannerella sp.]